MQFHPTCLYNLEVKNFLITEAMRGEGGRLSCRGTAIVSCRISTSAPSWPRATSSLAHRPRDEAATDSTASISTSATMSAECVDRAFPDDPRQAARGSGSTSPREPIPVVPAQHYTCGGVLGGSRRAHGSARPLGGRRGAPSPGSTAPTGSPRTRCWNVSCSASLPPATSPQVGTRCPPPPPIRAWDEESHVRFGRGGHRPA